jgi:hypothetical protein
MLRLALLALVPLLLLPGAAAQATGTIELRLEGVPAQPILPAVEQPLFTAVVTASCDLVLARAAPPGSSNVVAVEFQTSSGVVITGNPSLLLDPQQCVGAQTVEVAAPFQLSVPRTAPGLVPLPMVARATLPSGNPAQPAVEAAPVPFTVTAEYYSVGQAKLSSSLVRCSSCDRVVVPIELTNFGNARTQYGFEWASTPSGWDGRLPEVILVESPNSGHGPSNATVEVVVSGGGGEGAFVLVVQPSAADDPAKQGNPLTVNFLVRDTSLVGRATPMPPVAWLALVLVALALGRRGRGSAPAFLVLLVLAFPAASAGVRIVGIDLPEGPVPLGDSVHALVHAEADCTTLMARTSPSVDQPIAANLSWVASGGFVLAGPATMDFLRAPCYAGASAAPAQAAVQVTPDRGTPALVPFTQVVRVAFGPPAGGALGDLDPAEASAEFVTLAGPAVVSDIRLVDNNQDCDRCGEVRFDVELSNRGNVRATYTFELTKRPEEAWSVRVPEPIELDSPLSGGADATAATATFVVQPPAGPWAFGDFGFSIQSAAAGDDQARGIPLTGGFLVANTEPRDNPIPAPPTAPLSALAAVALLLARRRA